MDLSFLDESSAVTPLLVRLYDNHQLCTLVNDKSAEARKALIGGVGELLELELSPRENELFADVMIDLLKQAETDLRQAVSERIASRQGVPLRLVLQLANDEISVAAHVLQSSPVLEDMDLIYIIKSQGPAHWQAIATRRAVNEQVMNILAETRDFGTAVALAQNMSLALNEHVVHILAELAQESEDIARPLLRREEVSHNIASQLYQFVGQELKQFILKNYTVDTSILIDAVDDIVIEFVDSDQGDECMPTADMLLEADVARRSNTLSVELMLGALRRGQVRSFAAYFSKFTGMGPDVVAKILVQRSGQGLAVACKAFEISKADFVSFYLLTNRVRNKGRMVDLKDMTRAMNYFNRITPEIARNIMNGSNGSLDTDS